MKKEYYTPDQIITGRLDTYNYIENNAESMMKDLIELKNLMFECIAETKPYLLLNIKPIEELTGKEVLEIYCNKGKGWSNYLFYEKFANYLKNHINVFKSILEIHPTFLLDVETSGKDIPEEVLWFAIAKDPVNFTFFKNPTPEMKKKALDISIKTIKWMDLDCETMEYIYTLCEQDSDWVIIKTIPKKLYYTLPYQYIDNYIRNNSCIDILQGAKVLKDHKNALYEHFDTFGKFDTLSKIYPNILSKDFVIDMVTYYPDTVYILNDNIKTMYQLPERVFINYICTIVSQDYKTLTERYNNCFKYKSQSEISKIFTKDFIRRVTKHELLKPIRKIISSGYTTNYKNTYNTILKIAYVFYPKRSYNAFLLKRVLKKAFKKSNNK